MGRTDSYDRFTAGLLGVQTDQALDGADQGRGRNRLPPNIPFYDDFQLGGLFRLSGRPFGQLRGNSYALATALLYYRLSSHGGAIVKNLSVGVSIEGGNTWQDQQPTTFSGFKSAGSVYVIADT